MSRSHGRQLLHPCAIVITVHIICPQQQGQGPESWLKDFAVFWMEAFPLRSVPREAQLFCPPPQTSIQGKNETSYLQNTLMASSVTLNLPFLLPNSVYFKERLQCALSSGL